MLPMTPNFHGIIILSLIILFGSIYSVQALSKDPKNQKQEVSIQYESENATNVISKACAAIDKDGHLKDLKSIVYTGRFIIASPDQPKSYMFKMFLKRPFSCRIVWRDVEGKNVLAINPEAAFSYHVDANNTQSNGIVQLDDRQRLILGCELAENLYYFGQNPEISAKIINNGLKPASVVGIESHLQPSKTTPINNHIPMVFQITTQYSGDIHYDRFYDWENYKLIASKGPTGIISIQRGQQEVGGIIFPQSIEYYEGETLKRSLTLDKIELNVDLPDDLFEMPKTTGEALTKN